MTFDFPQFIKEIKKQKRLIAIILILIILIIASGVAYKILVKEKTGILPKKGGYSKIDINWDVLESRFLQESEQFEKISVFQASEEKLLGRENPFMPY